MPRRAPLSRQVSHTYAVDRRVVAALVGRAAQVVSAEVADERAGRPLGQSSGDEAGEQVVESYVVRLAR